MADTSECIFRLRILSFERLDYAQIGKAPRLEPIEEGAVRWLMRLEVVNLSKVNVLIESVRQTMRIVDGDGFQFERDEAGLFLSDFAKRSGLGHFRLLPKLKVQAAVIFKVPDEDAEYSLTIKNGTMEEA